MSFTWNTSVNQVQKELKFLDDRIEALPKIKENWRIDLEAEIDRDYAEYNATHPSSPSSSPEEDESRLHTVYSSPTKRPYSRISTLSDSSESSYATTEEIEDNDESRRSNSGSLDLYGDSDSVSMLASRSSDSSLDDAITDTGDHVCRCNCSNKTNNEQLDEMANKGFKSYILEQEEMNDKLRTAIEVFGECKSINPKIKSEFS